MSKRYTYSRSIDTPEGEETFTADQFDSFDEAITAVNKGIHDRQLFLDEKKKKQLVESLPVKEEVKLEGSQSNSTLTNNNTTLNK